MSEHTQTENAPGSGAYRLFTEVDPEKQELQAENARLRAEVEQLQGELEVRQARLWALTTALQVYTPKGLSSTGTLEEAAKLEAYVRGSHAHLVAKHLERD